MLSHRFALLSALVLSLLAPSLAHAVSACGVVDGRTVTECEYLREETTCTERCEPVSMVETCSTQCGGSCTETATTACTADCETADLTTCTADPTKYDCKPACTTHCESSCSGHCEGSLDTVKCAGRCKSECEQTCTTQCTALPATETCENKVKTSCEASCTASNNITCEVECETACSTQLQGACTTRCTTKQGALFCQDQYIEGGADMGKCIDEIQLSGATVEGWIVVAADGTATGTKTEGSGCTSAGETRGVLPIALGGLVLAILVRRRARAQSLRQAVEGTR